MNFPPFKKFSLFNKTETIQTTSTDMEDINSVEGVIKKAKEIVSGRIVVPANLESIKTPDQNRIESLETSLKEIAEERDRLKEDNEYLKGLVCDSGKFIESLEAQRDKAIEEIKNWPDATMGWVVKYKILELLSPKEKDPEKLG